MTNSPEQLAELTVTKLFTNGQYIIPIYQRNYAWGKMEIEQLLQDLMDAASQSQQEDYYLGSLVVHQRKDGKFEIIDGQQRHTTLCILMAVLRNEYRENEGVENLIPKGINLEFKHRSVSSETLQHLFNNGLESDAENMESAMVGAYKIAQTYLAHIFPKNSDGKENHDNQKVSIYMFATYLSNHAKLLRVIVPKDTDLNHYFEIMNSRGEQLEKHEVLKARLMNVLEPDKRTAFAKIWDACADMSRYVQFGFSAIAPKGEADSKAISERVAVFRDDWNQCPKDFDALVKNISNKADGGNGAKLSADNLKFPTLKDKNDTDIEKGKYGSVINFPNFLLQVLSVLDPKQPVMLDDKKLLESFDSYLNDKINSAQFAKDFIVALLRMRFLFDKWIIKTASDTEHWILKTIKNGKNYPINSASAHSDDENSNEKLNQQLIMLLSMFHVSFPSQNYKQWLRETLSYLYEVKDSVIDGQLYLAHLEKMSNRFFSERFKGDEAVLHKGTSVQHFFFNRLDYLLWKKIVIDNSEMPKTDNNEAVKKLAGSFRFTFRSSIEHHYPQHPDSGVNMDNCDRFGNLCLISHSNNSRYSNLDVAAKKSHRKNSNANESLKQIIMMGYGEWGPSVQGLKNIQQHEDEMIALLNSAKNEPS